MVDITDEQILELAQELRQSRGISLTDAMIMAESQLQPKPTLPEEFTVTIPVKARVAKWIIDEFGGHTDYSIEYRLGFYLQGVLNRSRVKALRYAEDAPDIQEGRAVTIPRAKFAEKEGK